MSAEVSHQALPSRHGPKLAQCLISFGSNLGDRVERIADAARLIGQQSMVADFKTSRLYQTPPIGGPGGQEPFLNAVAAFQTQASAAAILEMLQAIENQLGRRRKERWGARSIDLDVVLHGELIGGRAGLVVPHPRYTARRFVLRPACDVAAHYRDPRFGWTLSQLADHIDQGVPSMALAGGTQATRDELCRRLEADHPIKIYRHQIANQPVSVIGNVPAVVGPMASQDRDGVSQRRIDQADASEHASWLADFVPPLPSSNDSGDCHQAIRELLASPATPRLIARLQFTSASDRWPAPHQMWPAGWNWPEYRLELDDFDWATGEVVSAMASMRCPLEAVTEDGDWYR